MNKVAIGSADYVDFVPTSMLVDYDLQDLPVVDDNPAKQAGKPTKLCRRGQWKVSLYDGFEGLIVRTMLLRSDKFEKIKEFPEIKSSNDIARLCHHLAMMDREHIVVLCLNSRNQVVAIHETAIGLISQAQSTHPLLLKAPILSNAEAVILVHNHPGGVAKPSDDDFRLSVAMKKACDCVGLILLDSVIVAANGHYSMRAEGKI